MSRARGFALTDVAIAIAVVAILLLAISGALGVIENGRVSSAERSIETLRSAATNWLSNGRTSFTGITFTDLRQENLLPAGFSESGSNPWGGSYSISGNLDQVTITLTNVPSGGGDALQRKFGPRARSAAYNSGTKTFTVTF